MNNILLGVTGSVAAKLTPKIVAALEEPDHEVRVIATEASLHFFDSENIPVSLYRDRDEWPDGGYEDGAPIPHIELREWADLFLIAPATANTLAKMAGGICDNLLTSTIRAWPIGKPMLIAPAMNTRMWENPLTQDHIDAVARIYQAVLIPPIEKRLACGEYGMGAIAELPTIRRVVREYLQHIKK